MNKPPVPKKIPKKLESHNDIRIDDYYWLRDDERKNKEIISYLEDENKYTDKGSKLLSNKEVRKAFLGG